jgi:thiol:disulfide interchange protein DsbG
MRQPTTTLSAVCAALAVSLAAWSVGTLADTPAATHEAAPKALQGATWFVEGTAHPKHVLYALVDANCPFCHEFWQSAQSLYGSGVQVRYLLVGILAENSPAKAAAILEAPKPAVAWDWNETHWQRLPGDLGGGIQPLSSPSPKSLAEMHRNETLAHDLGIQGTPAIIYMDKQGRLQVVQSAPDAAALRRIAEDASSGQ